MENKEVVSIVIPIYNVEAYLKQCLETIVNQTYPNLEIILVNDGSPDKSEEICKEFFKRDSRIRYVRQVNGGLSAARNTGIDLATGDYITFVDPDDWVMWRPCTLSLRSMRQMFLLPTITCSTRVPVSF